MLKVPRIPDKKLGVEIQIDFLPSVKRMDLMGVEPMSENEFPLLLLS